MDRQELIAKLADFKRICLERGYMEGDLYITEPFEGMLPPSYIVNMRVNQAWLDSLSSRGKALDALLEVLWETTTSQTRVFVYTIGIYSDDQSYSFAELQKKAAA